MYLKNCLGVFSWSGFLTPQPDFVSQQIFNTHFVRKGFVLFDCIAIASIFQVCANNKKRLGLSFQPNNPLMGKAFSESKKSSGVLLKVKVKKTTVNNEIKKEVLSTTVLGRVTQMHRFEGKLFFVLAWVWQVKKSTSHDLICWENQKLNNLHSDLISNLSVMCGLLTYNVLHCSNVWFSILASAKWQ